MAREDLIGSTALSEANDNGAAGAPTVTTALADPELTPGAATAHVVLGLLRHHNADQVKDMFNLLNMSPAVSNPNLATALVFAAMYVANVLQGVPLKQRDVFLQAIQQLQRDALTQRSLANAAPAGNA